jgi:hypothetical protein
MEHIIYTCKQTFGSNTVAALVFKEEGVPSGMASEVSQSDILIFAPLVVGLVAYYFHNFAARLWSGFSDITSKLAEMPSSFFTIGPIMGFEHFIFGTPQIAFNIPKISEENKMILETFGYKLKGTGRSNYWYGPTPTEKIILLMMRWTRWWLTQKKKAKTPTSY